MLITKIVNVRVFPILKHLENLGYTFIKHRISNKETLYVPRNLFINIKTTELLITSSIKIEYKCDKCNKKLHY